MARIIQEPSTTFDEWLLEPGETKPEHEPDRISLRSPIASFMKGEKSALYLNSPFLSASMQSVTGSGLAIALAREGGLGFIYCSQTIESQAAMVAEVKNHKAGLVRSDSNLAPTATLQQAIDLSKKTGHSTIAVTHDGSPNGKLEGILTDNDYWIEKDDPTRPIGEYMTPFDRLAYGNSGVGLSEANEILWKRKKKCLPIVDNEQRLVALVFKKDYRLAKDFPHSLVDGKKRFLAAAAVNSKDYERRVPALVEAGADVLCFDSSDGFSTYQADGLRWVKSHYPNMIIGAGNVVNTAGFEYLMRAGADFIKVGIGGGSICTTREMKAIGRGQADAVMDIAAYRDEKMKSTGKYVPIISDGGVVFDSHIILALAMGADAVMMGRYFAMTDESPTPVKDIDGQFFKPYWGEGSARARNWQRYAMGGEDSMKFEEGVEGYVPVAGPLSKKVRLTASKIRSTMGNCGVKDMIEFHEQAVLRRVSPATLKESAPHDILRFEWRVQDGNSYR